MPKIQDIIDNRYRVLNLSKKGSNGESEHIFIKEGEISVRRREQSSDVSSRYEIRFNKYVSAYILERGFHFVTVRQDFFTGGYDFFFLKEYEEGCTYFKETSSKNPSVVIYKKSLVDELFASYGLSEKVDKLRISRNLSIKEDIILIKILDGWIEKCMF